MSAIETNSSQCEPTAKPERKKNGGMNVCDVHTLTDDEIVGAIARHGIFGIDVGTDLDDDNEPSGEAVAMAFELGLIGDEVGAEDMQVVRLLLSRIWIAANQGTIVEAHLGTTICLTLDYWAERLAHRSKEQCRQILYTGPR